MTTTRRSRRRKLGAASQGRARTARLRAPELESGEPVSVATMADQTISVQLPDPYCSDGRLPEMAVGQTLELAPTIFMSRYSPLEGDDAAW
jgi:hypothetical protein